jgi:hypothetical protein
MKIVYIAAPFRAKNAWEIEKNIRRAEVIGFEVAKLGAMPLIPHANTRFFHGTLPDQFWLDGTMELLRRCDAAFFLAGWEKSSGCRAEREEAERRMAVFEYLPDLELWLAAPEDGK